MSGSGFDSHARAGEPRAGRVHVVEERSVTASPVRLGRKARFADTEKIAAANDGEPFLSWNPVRAAIGRFPPSPFGQTLSGLEQ